LLFLLAALTAGCAPQTPPATLPAAGAPGAGGAQSPTATDTALPSDALDVTWLWESLVTPVETVRPDRPELYTLQFDRSGRVAVRADCNRGSSQYTVSAGRRITLGAMALTRAACPPGSLSDRFARDVGRVSSYFVRDGALFLEMPVDSGTFRFTRK
jgi:para-nitrobenzyl esterase